MKSNPVIKIKEACQVTVGSVVIAQPFWKDVTYKRAVILITDHDSKGSRGIIINKASTIDIHDALPEINEHDPVYFGGPFAPRIISFLHSIHDIPEADYLGSGIFLGGDTASLSEMIEEQKIDFEKIKFCAGDVEWTAGELDYEISENQWWVSKITARELFENPPEALWSLKLLQRGNHLFGLFAPHTDPSLN